KISTKKEKRTGELLAQVHPEDLIKFGLIPEFVGRLPVVATLNELDKGALIEILKEPKNSLVRQYQTIMGFENVTLKFTDDALEAIVGEELKRNVGARGLKIIIEELMLDMVVFPSMMAPFVVGRRASIQALDATLSTNEKRIFLATQRDPKVDGPNMQDIYNVGVIATVVQNLKLPNQNVKVMVEGLSRAEITGWEEGSGYVNVIVREIDSKLALTPEVSQYMQKLVEIFEQYAKMSQHHDVESVMSTQKLD